MRRARSAAVRLPATGSGPCPALRRQTGRFPRWFVQVTPVLFLGCGDPAWRPGALVDPPEAEAPADSELWETSDIVPFEPGPDDPTAPREGTARAETGAPTIHYLNFCDGTTTLMKGGDNAPLNRSSICGHTSAGCPKYAGTEAEKKAFADALHAMWLPYNVLIVIKRPTSGSYSMEMIAPQGNGCNFGSGVGGIAPGDCGNRSNVNVSFTFFSKGAAGIPGYVVTAQETGHAWGLSHVDTACDVMGAAYSKKGCAGGKWGYPDTSAPTIGGTVCSGQSTQNSHQMLLKALGPWPGGPKPSPDGAVCDDKLAPTVKIIEPADRAKVPVTFKVRAEIGDDCPPIKKARIRVPERGLMAETATVPAEWTLEDMPPGSTLEVVVEAIDGRDRLAMQSIHVEVQAGGMSPSPTDGAAEPGAPPDAGNGPDQGGKNGRSGTIVGTGCNLVGAGSPATLPPAAVLLGFLLRVQSRRASTLGLRRP